MATVSVREDVTELLQRLIRVDTVNPPGNETQSAELLREYLEASGVRCEVYAKVPQRANLVARIPGRGDGPRLALLSHTDTVLADPGEWQVDPWSGELRDGEVWGRGALDMKGQVAASAVTIASLAREGFEPAGDLIFVAAADEEVGAGFGLSWLCAEHPDAVRAEYALNEGGGDRLEFGGKVLYLCATAEKMTSPFRLRVRGRSGHGSMPGIADNALLKASRLIQRLDELEVEPQLGPETTAFLEVVSNGAAPPAREALALARQAHPLGEALLEPLLAMTVAPTMIEASKKRNVIPATCDVTVDCRLLPGQSPDDAEQLIRTHLGGNDYEFEWLERQGGTRSPIESPLWDTVATFVSDIEPGAEAAPVLVPGFTDSHWMRDAFETVAYGFFPMRTMPAELALRLIHSADERVAVEDLELGVHFLRHAAEAIGGMQTLLERP
jgi:acetylornithine deacetylase/succinyl-diaminopimelate desuccinylase-like protein